METPPRNTIFKIRFTAENLHPHTIRASELAELLTATESAITSLVHHNNPEINEDSILFGLATLEDQSVGLGWWSAQAREVFDAFEDLTQAFQAKSFDQLPARTLEGLREISKFARERSCQTLFVNTPESGGDEVVLVLEPDFSLEIPKAEYIRGETTLYGYVDRVGGIQPKVKLRLGDGSTLHCNLDAELAKDVGAKLYKDIGLKGVATWDIKDYSIIYFRATELLSYEESNPIEAFRELSEAVGKSFEKVHDPDAWAKAIRHGEDGE